MQITMKPKCKNCDHCFIMKGDTWCGKQLQYCNKEGWCKEYKRAISPEHIGWLIIACAAIAILIKCIV